MDVAILRIGYGMILVYRNVNGQQITAKHGSNKCENNPQRWQRYANMILNRKHYFCI